MFMMRISPYCRFSPRATSAYTPPVMRPEASSSSQAPKDMRVPWVLLPGGLRRVQRGGGDRLRPHHLELAVLPLAHAAGRGHVLAALEADRPEDGLVLGLRDVVAQRLAVQTHLGDAGLDDLQRRPAGARGPAVGL